MKDMSLCEIICPITRVVIINSMQYTNFFLKFRFQACGKKLMNSLHSMFLTERRMVKRSFKDK